MVGQSTEEAVWYDADGESILGILTHPVGVARDVGVIFLNGGWGCSSAGKNRLYTRMATELSARGFHTLRLGWRGIGDCTGEIDEYVMEEPFTGEVVGAAELLRSRGVSQIAIYGECFGARCATAAAPEISGLVAMYLVTLVLRDFAVSEQTPQRLAYSLPTTAYFRKVGKIRHLGDPRRRRLYTRLVRFKAKQLSRGAVRKIARDRLPHWVSPHVVRELTEVSKRDVAVRLIYGTSAQDHHGIDFLAVVDHLQPLRSSMMDYEIFDEIIAGYRTVQVQDRLIGAVATWLDQVCPARDPATLVS